MEKDNKTTFDNILKRCMNKNEELKLFSATETELLKEYLRLQRRRDILMSILVIMPIIILLFMSLWLFS